MFRFSAEDERDLISFLRDLARIPSLSTQEEEVAIRLAEEMRRVGFQGTCTLTTWAASSDASGQGQDRYCCTMVTWMW
jgi:metal-dependent amidase/aminoacylase/carboxypeptidase family protein